MLGLCFLLLTAAAWTTSASDPLSTSHSEHSSVPKYYSGTKKFGDKCENTWECGFDGGICDAIKKSCQCLPELPATNHIDKCGKEAAVNESCFFDEQCESSYFQTKCQDGKCVCRFDMKPVFHKDGSVECIGDTSSSGPTTYIDPTMIGILVVMFLMFIIICVVLRLFSKARWQENRTIFNTPNPRLMNVSLLRDAKHTVAPEERRGSHHSVSRQHSAASLRLHSPSNPQVAGIGTQNGRRESKGSYGTGLKSPTSNTKLEPATLESPLA
ncbi:unnamed protein product [Bemisia tabaci]|uniref:EB domain-containing protein n=1 Tax=Bemisia tabaci TaxID=7038 RepID=A0A9P0G691_BEMTA|nr:PREDICTED: uncharacterized protein LOC109036087 [Bemisia tabaci]CAH0778386.1 unnamed protein product [Bemisia tabaci]